jgi:hypothetical protein
MLHAVHERHRLRRKPTEVTHRPSEREWALDEHIDRVLTFRQWCLLNNLSLRTGRRLLKKRSGPNRHATKRKSDWRHHPP